MKPNCAKCKHYFITFNQSTPRGCRIYQIQSATMPSQVVKRANNGDECVGFSPKQTTNSEAKIDLNNSKYW